MNIDVRTVSQLKSRRNQPVGQEKVLEAALAGSVSSQTNTATLRPISPTVTHGVVREGITSRSGIMRLR